MPAAPSQPNSPSRYRLPVRTRSSTEPDGEKYDWTSPFQEPSSHRERRDATHEPSSEDEDDTSAGLTEYADTVTCAIGDRTNLIVVAQSVGAFTAPARLRQDRRIPSPTR